MVEGYIDAIAMSEAGFPNVVAPLGTALTPDQCALLWAMASEPILCFDGDGAGRARGVPRHRDRAAADRRGQEPALRASARGAGSGRSDPAQRPPGDGGTSQGRAAARRHAVHARNGRRAFRHARAARGARAPPRRGGRENRRRDPAPPLPGRREAAPLAFFGDGRERPAGGYASAKQPFVPRRGGRFPPPGPRMGVAETPLAPQSKLGRSARLPARRS